MERHGGLAARLAQRIYRLLLAAYPRGVRREDGEEMRRMFSDIYRHEPESQGMAGRAGLGAATLRDIATGSIKERRPFLDNVVQDLRYGLRRLRDNPTLTVAAVLTLGIGIGAVTAVYSLVDAMVMSPLPYPRVERIVALGETTPRRDLNGEGWASPPVYRQWQELQSLESVAALRPFFSTMTGAGDPQEIFGYRASEDFFALLGVEPLIGRAFGGPPSGEMDEDVVVLGYACWQRYFNGDAAVLGQSVRLDGHETIIIGVLPRGAEFPMGTDLWMPLTLTPEQWASYTARQVRTIGRLADGATVAQLRAELEPLDAELAVSHPDTHSDVRIAVEPILENLTGPTRSGLAFLMGAAAFLLLLVCGNVANMQLAQASARHREMAMRMALGAGRVRLVRQLLTESLALASIAIIVGTLFAAWGANGLRIGLSDARWRFFFAGVDEVGINLAVLLFAAAVSLGSVVAFGLLPALHCSRVDLNDALKQSAGGGAHGAGRLRRSLVALEVALSIVLLVGAGLMARSLNAFTRFDPGIDTGTIAMQLRLPRDDYPDPARRADFFAEAVARVASVPGIAAAGIADRIPASAGTRGSDLEIDGAGQDTPQPHEAERHLVGGAYFEALGIPILRGKAFEPGDRTGETNVVIVSATLAERLWPGEAPIGRRLRFGADEPWRTVSGVAADVARAWNDPQPSAAAYLPIEQSSGISMRLLLRITGDLEFVARGVQEQIWAINDAVVVFAPQAINEVISWRRGGALFMSKLVSAIAITALLVCIGGIYALVAYSAGQRTQEIGVRLALGADRSEVVRMLVLDGLKTTAIGLAFGLAAAFSLARLLAGFMQGILTVDPLVFLLLAGGMLLIATLSSWVPARRGAGVEPVVALRAD